MYQAKFGQDSLIKATPDIFVFGVQTKDSPAATVEPVVGFEKDLTHALATRLGKKRIVRQLSEEQLFSELSDNGVHIIAQETNTALQPEEDTILLFSHPYLEQETTRLFALSKNNESLLILINNALDEMKEDGTITELRKKWDLL
jgi:ABC-type amino acid transport substrate-binding protein